MVFWIVLSQAASGVLALSNVKFSDMAIAAVQLRTAGEIISQFG